MFEFVYKHRINIFSFLCLLTTIAFFVFYFQNSVFIFDDYWACFARKPFFKMLIQDSDHGCYLSAFMMKMQGTMIALKMHMHPNDYNATYGAAFKGIVFFFIPYLMSSIFYLNKKKDMLFISSLLFFIFAIFYMTLAYDPLLFLGNLFFYRYTMYAGIYIAFMYWFLKRFSGENIDLKFKDYCLCLLFGLIIGNSDILAPQVFIAISMFFAIFAFKNKKYFKLFSSLGLSLSVGILSFLFNPFFQEILKWRSTETSVFVASRWKLIAVQLPQFLHMYFKNIIMNSWIYVLIALLLFVIIAFKTKFKNESVNFKIIFSFCILSSWFLYYFSFIYLDPTSNDSYFLNQKQLLFLFHLTFLTVITLFLGIIVENLNIKKIYSVIFSIILILSSFAFVFNKKIYYYYDFLLDIRGKTYETEKVALYLYKNNMPVVLPDSMLKTYYTAFPHVAIEYRMLLHYLEDPDTLIPENEIDKIMIYESSYKDKYLKSLYNIDLKYYSFSGSPKLLEKYKENGFSMDKNEIYSESFSSLYSYYDDVK